jgi:2'-5' RNA ligase
MNQLRAFIAIDPPAPLQESIEEQISRLRQTLGKDVIRWVPARNMHLTLKFLGNTPATHLDFLKQMLSQAADSTPKFDLTIGGFGSFPTSNRIRVLWVGVHAPAALASLQREIEAGAARLGYEKDGRPFSPHLTVGRVRQGIDARNLQKIRDTITGFQLGRIGTAGVDSVHLYQSDLHADGSVYTRLFSAPLR